MTPRTPKKEHAVGVAVETDTSLFSQELSALLKTFRVPRDAVLHFGVVYRTLQMWASGAHIIYPKVVRRAEDRLRQGGVSDRALQSVLAQPRSEVIRAEAFVLLREQGWSLLQIGQQEGLSRERVRQILKFANRKVVYTCPTEGCANKRGVHADLCTVCKKKQRRIERTNQIAAEHAQAPVRLREQGLARFKKNLKQEGEHLLWMGKVLGSSPWTPMCIYGKARSTSPRAIAWWLTHHEVLPPGTHLFVTCGNQRCLTHISLNNPDNHRLRDTCFRGHPRTAESIYVVPSTGQRNCRICQGLLRKGLVQRRSECTPKRPKRVSNQIRLSIAVLSQRLLDVLTDGQSHSVTELTKILSLSGCQVRAGLRNLLALEQVQRQQGPRYIIDVTR